MRVTSKGQVTIPQAVRRAAGIHPGDEVVVSVGDDGVVTLRRAEGVPTRGRRAVERMRGAATVQMSTDEIMALTRGDG